MKPIWILAVTGVGLALRPVAGWAAEVGPVPAGTALTAVYINQLAEQLRTNHPSLKASAARVEAASQATRAVRTWEDPTLTVGGMFADQEMSADQGNLLYGIEQKLPLFGKPAAERRVAEAERDVALARGEARFQQLRRDLARVLFQTAVNGYAVTIDREDLGWLDTLHAAVEAQYRVGRSTQVELLQVENDRARRATEIRTGESRLAHDGVSLNRMLGRPLDSAWPALRLPDPAPAVVFTPRLVELALQSEPATRVLRRETQQAEAMANQARRAKAPEVSVGFLGRNYAGDGSFRQGDLMIQFSVPWGNAGRYRSAVLREKARQQAAQLDVADAEQSLREEIHGLTVAIDAARREALLYQDDILPRTERALSSARTAWESGAGMFRDVLEQRRALVESRLRYAQAVAEQYRLMSDLVLCCGLGDFESLRMIGAEIPAAASVRP